MSGKSKALLVACFVLLWVPQFSFAEEKQYPPYPDVWERVFVDNIDEHGLRIAPNKNGDAVVDQWEKIDDNGESVKDRKGNSVGSTKVLLFFENRVEVNLDANGIHRLSKGPEYTEQTHSSGWWSNFISRNIPVRDGAKIRWMKALVTDGYDQYHPDSGYKRQVVDGVLLYQMERSFPTDDQTPHTIYYNRPTVLEKIDKNGNVVWQKVYLYFHPWWRTVYQKDEGVIQAFINFMYFKLGTIALLDEDRMFLYFGGARKIFRLAPDGNPRTEDKDLVVMEYRDYKEMTEGLIKKVDRYKKTISPLEPSDYDYLGEQLAKERGIEIKSTSVAGAMKQHKDLAQDIDAYYREMEKKGTR